ncbi:TPRcontaining protein [Trypanosoma grayi]|uniref:TPRcontaining protein n=1 Tax=Trypanosoma grayi TaxID=71804 RepID=UPI0004F45949|nr:TPRcontaining protein [Trypanosoma grayi]KEG11959.1 TPRcontaining protein [Trypanosoma grayi]
MGDRLNVTELYRSYCAEEECRANSAVLRYIENHGVTQPLEELVLSSNYLGPRGLCPIIRLIADCQTITRLNLDGNGADNTTVELLCAVLEKHMSIQSLSLRSNPITVTGGKHLLSLVERNPNITAVDLTGTDVFDALIYKIQVAAEANKRRMVKDVPQLTPTEVDMQQMTRGHIGCTAARPSVERPSLATLPAVVRDTTASTVAAAAATSVAAGGRKLLSRHEQLPQGLKGGPLLTRVQPRPPIPATASRESTRLPELRRQELRRRYREKALLFREINASQASRAADRAREELMLLEQNTRSANTRKTWEARAMGSTSKSPHSTHVLSVEVVEMPSTGANTSVEPSPKQQLQDEEKGTQGDSVADVAGDALDNANETGKRDGGNEDAGRNTICGNKTPVTDADPLAEASVIPGECSEDVGTESESAAATAAAAELFASGDADEDDDGDESSLDVLRNSPHWMALDSVEQFQRLFDSGCRAYVRQHFDVAYTAWNEAMGIAVSKNNREWMAVLSNNLQRLSYEMLVREGVEQLDHDQLEEADAAFQRALEVAQKAHNAKWEGEMYKARKNVQHAVFQRCHEAALKVFERAQQLPEQNVTDDDYFVVPGTDVMLQHTASYVNEWPRMLLVKEAVETWTASRRVIDRIGGSAGRVLLNVVEEALDTVACFLVQRCFDTEDTQSLSWMRTSHYSYHECIMLSTLWTDMASCDNFATHHKLFAALAAAQIGNFCLATNQLSHAQSQFDTLETLAVELDDPLLRAAGRTFSALVNWQRARYAAAESLLRAAVLEWGVLREVAAQQRNNSSNNTNNGIGGSKLLASVSGDFVAMMEAVSFKYLVSSIASTYRYGEALEVLERGLVSKHRDLLFDKMKVNFGAQPTLDHIVATSSQIRSPFLYQMTTHRYEWSQDERRYVADEKLHMWVVPQGNEMRYVEVAVTKDFKVPSINSLVEAVRRGLLLDPLSDCGTGASDIVMTFPKRAWVEPLQTLYAIFIDPVVEFLRALDPLFMSNNGVITLIPTERLWLVPFNALIARNGNFLVEDFAVQMAFCATQCAFSALSARRVQQRDLRRDVVFVQRETDTTAPQMPTIVTFPFDALRSQQEGETIVRTLEQHKRDVRHSSRTTDSVSVTRSSEVLIDDLDALRNFLPKSRTVHITAPTTCATRNDEGGAGAICVAVSRDEVGLLRASEIARMELFAELVVMSNTNMSTARVAGTHDDVQGLIRGFVSSGVPCVIVGQWCTPDMVPSKLFAKFYELLSEANRQQKQQKQQQRSVSANDTTTTSATAAAAAAAAAVAATMAENPVDEEELGAHDAANLHCHKALILAWAIRALLEESFFRYSPRTWAGYCCVGYGSYQ